MASVVNKGTKARPIYHARIKMADGRWTTRATQQPTKAGARMVAVEMQARIMRGLLAIPDPVEVQQSRITVVELAEKFSQEYNRPKIRNIEKYRRVIRSAISSRLRSYPLGSIPASAVRSLDVVAYRDALHKDKYAGSTINWCLQFMSSVFSWALEQKLFEGDNPVSKVERMPEAPSEDFYLMEEIHRLLAVPELPPMIACALYTGMRRGELYGLTWPCVRLDDVIPKIEVKHSFAGPTKNGKSRTIPIHPELLPWLQAWQRRCPSTAQAVVFPLKGAEGYRIATENEPGDNELLREILKKAGCRHEFARPWHAFRHSFATHLLEATGGNEDAVAKMLGHTSRANSAPAVTRGYTHTSTAYLYRELQKMSLAPIRP